jgi:hypothetical protein
MKMRLPYAALAAIVVLLPARPARAHCDTLDGPVARDCRLALDTGDAAPALKWVAPEQETEIRTAFAQARSVRSLGGDAQALADRFFLETVVRIHRLGEGAPYTGLRPSGSETDPGIAAADRALESGSVETLAAMVARQVDQGLRQRFQRVEAARKRAGGDVALGREYVAAYVDFIHYAEGVARAAAGPNVHGRHEEAAPVHEHP